MRTPTRIEAGARHPRRCRPLLAGQHTSAIIKGSCSLRRSSIHLCISRKARTTRQGSGGVIHNGASARLWAAPGARSWARRERYAPLWITLVESRPHANRTDRPPTAEHRSSCRHWTTALIEARAVFALSYNDLPLALRRAQGERKSLVPQPLARSC